MGLLRWSPSRLGWVIKHERLAIPSMRWARCFLDWSRPTSVPDWTLHSCASLLAARRRRRAAPPWRRRLGRRGRLASRPACGRARGSRASRWRARLVVQWRSLKTAMCVSPWNPVVRQRRVRVLVLRVRQVQRAWPVGRHGWTWCPSHPPLKKRRLKSLWRSPWTLAVRTWISRGSTRRTGPVWRA